MARDLSFWKYKKNVVTDNESVYALLSAGELSELIDSLPVVEIYDVRRMHLRCTRRRK